MKWIKFEDTLLCADYLSVIQKDEYGREDGMRYQIFLRLMGEDPSEDSWEVSYGTHSQREEKLLELMDFLVCTDRRMFDLK